MRRVPGPVNLRGARELAGTDATEWDCRESRFAALVLALTVPEKITARSRFKSRRWSQCLQRLNRALLREARPPLVEEAPMLAKVEDEAECRWIIEEVMEGVMTEGPGR